jgi:hypothetical protein
MSMTATLSPPSSGVALEAIAAMDRYDARCTDLAATAGVLNAAHGHLVEVAVACLAEGDHSGPGLVSFAHFLAWRLGISVSTAKSIEVVARRADELPVLCATLVAGEISLDQAAVVARNVPAAFDRGATDLAKMATVSQLKAVLPAYRETKPTTRSDRGVHLSGRDDGSVALSGRLDADQAALVEQALKAMREDLLRQRREDAATAAAETGEDPAPIPMPTGADALAALAETAMQATEAAHPGTERCLISYHLQATADGRWMLVDQYGNVVAEPERRRLLCDHQFEDVHHDHRGVPLSVGRKTRHIDPRLRRAILHRHLGRCAVPGCDATRGLEIHHIVHWEDGGPTNTDNLVPLCRHHHRSHHHHGLHIDGNPNLPAGTPGALHIGPRQQPLEPVGQPDPLPTPRPPTRTAGHLRRHLRARLGRIAPVQPSTPLGERLDRHGFHLEPDPPHP